MARAWELIGEDLVPDQEQQELAHKGIEELIENGIPPELEYMGDVDRPHDGYEIWPEKFAGRTWDLMQHHRLAGKRLASGEFPFTERGGLLIMAKLADACGGSTFARVTDRLLAFGLIADRNPQLSPESEVVPITLDLIDAKDIPLEKLIDFRHREATEQRGGDYTKLRHRYADVVQKHVEAIKAVATTFERHELNRQFKDDMERDLAELREELRVEKIQLILKPVVVATVLAAGTAAAAVLHGGQALIGADLGGAALKEGIKHVAELFSTGLSFSRKQKEIMAKHPMAYMYALSRA
jgi:hypothetical protein